MSRLPAAKREALASKDQSIWDSIAAARPAMGGPYSVLMHLPGLAERVAHLEDYFRLSGSLSTIDREIVILATARESGAHYPWTRHEIRGREAGVRAEVIETLRANGPLGGLTAREQLLVDIVRSLLRHRALSDELYARAEAALSREEFIETVTLMGHYSLIGAVVNAFDVKAPAGSRTF